MAETSRTPPAPQAGAGAQGAAQIKLDESTLHAAYANFCRVTGTPEEVILDLGLSDHPHGPGATTVPIDQRIVLNHFTAKRLLGALHAAVQRHEAAFGMIETDVQKRAAGRKS